MCSVVWFGAIYCAIAGTFMATGANQQNAIATLNGTFVRVNWCSSSCDNDIEFGKWCNQEFEASMAWNFANDTFIIYNKTLHWRSSCLTCDNITENASLSVMIERNNPSVPYGLEPPGKIYLSGLTLVGQGMFSLLVGVAAIGLVSGIITLIFECVCKRGDYEKL